MNHSKQKALPVAACLAVILVLGGCHKKAVAPPPPPPPKPAPAPAPAPTASIRATPLVIDQGQSATLAWSTTNATSASIGGIGTVATSGSQVVSPTRSATFTLSANGPGGSAEATARITVNPPPPAPLPPSITEEQLFEQNVNDVYFDYDKADLRPQDSTVTEQDAAFLVKHPDMKLVIEGHCDERGSAEYNLALGQMRAESLQHALVSDGVPASRIRVTSLGKEKPFCTESN